MKIPVLALPVLLLLASCATDRGYRHLPAVNTAVDLSSDLGETFVIELDPAFGEPIGVRYEFNQRNDSRGARTTYSPRHPDRQTFLDAAEVARLRTLLLAFDWNHAVDPQDPNATRLVPDDPIVLFRARTGSVYHEARVGLSNSTALDHLLRELGLLK